MINMFRNRCKRLQVKPGDVIYHALSGRNGVIRKYCDQHDNYIITWEPDLFGMQVETTHEPYDSNWVLISTKPFNS